MNSSGLITRVKSILLTPKTEWPVIAAEPATTVGIYTGYILLLAALPALCQFIRLAVFGYSVPLLGTMHISIPFAVEMAVRLYLGSVIGCFLMALIVNALAPTFGGQKDSVQALKVVAYSYTASWIAGIAVLLPALGFLIMIVGLIYGIYLLYLGLPPTMKCPPEKAGAYTAVTLICGIILGVLLMYVLGVVLGLRSQMGMGGMGFDRTSHATFDRNSPAGQLSQWAQGVAAAGKQLEAAQKSGDSQAAANAVGQMMTSAVSGGQKVEALAPDRLKGFLPDTLGGLKRTEASAERNGALGMQVATATARYGDESGGRSLKLEVTDMGGAKGVLAVASHANIEEDRQTDSGYVKTYQQGGSLIHEQWDNASKEGEYSAVVADRFMVKVQGSGSSIDELKSALGGVDMTGLAALKNEGVRPD
jgi:hypothetical protein